MQGYEEVVVGRNPNEVPLLFRVLYLKAKNYYLFYMIHDLIWSLLFLIPGIILRIEVIDLASYVSLFGKNYSTFIYIIISFGGFFLLLVIVFSAFFSEVPFNYAKKGYIIWRIAISVIHFLLCLYLLIFFAIFDPTMKTILEESNVNKDVIITIKENLDYGLAIMIILCMYSLINIYNCLVLIKACQKINGDLDLDGRINTKGNNDWVETEKKADIMF